MTFHVPEKWRILGHGLGNYGAFVIPGPCGRGLHCIASEGDGWEHVSVSLYNRIPDWQEMCFIKDIFWDEEDMVIQYHPPKSEYINFHPCCLHLWKPIGIGLPCPPSYMIGPKPRG